MGRAAKWVLAVSIAVGVVCVFNACATTGDGDNPAAGTPAARRPASEAGTSSGASGSGSGSGSGSSSGSGSGGTVEDATLGDDASGDAGDEGGEGGDEAGQAPPACAPGQACVDVAPSGWSGFVQLLLGNGDAGAGACSAPYAVSQATGVADPVGAPADCSSCNCLVGDAGPITCSVGIGTANLLCAPGGPTTPAVQNTCVPVTGANGSSVGPTVTSSAGTCSPAPALAAPSAPAAVVCALGLDAGAPLVDAGALDAGSASGPSCAATQACATPFTAPAGSPSGVCIYKAGVVPCPSGSYSSQHVVGTSIADTRACSCGCVNPSCPTDGYVTGYTSNTCSGNAATTFDASTPCVDFANANGSTAFIYHPSHGTFEGLCTTVDAGPSGSVAIAAAGATTYCCIP